MRTTNNEMKFDFQMKIFVFSSSRMSNDWPSGNNKTTGLLNIKYNETE
jgi:hypothetical protein